MLHVHTHSTGTGVTRTHSTRTDVTRTHTHTVQRDTCHMHTVQGQVSRKYTQSTGTGVTCTHTHTVQGQMSHAHTDSVMGTKKKRNAGWGLLLYRIIRDRLLAPAPSELGCEESMEHSTPILRRTAFLPERTQVWRPEKGAAQREGGEAHEVIAQSYPATDTSSSFHSTGQLRCLRDCRCALWAQWHNCIQQYKSVSHWRT